VLRPPLGTGLVAVEVDGGAVTSFAADEVVVRRCPSEVVLRHRATA
jgi:hypothetical protein